MLLMSIVHSDLGVRYAGMAVGRLSILAADTMMAVDAAKGRSSFFLIIEQMCVIIDLLSKSHLI